MKLSAFADLESAVWDIAVDGRWLGKGPGNDGSGQHPVIDLPEVDTDRAGSARLLVIWLDDGEVFTLSATRPANAKGQDRDEFSIGLPESEAGMQVFDPRLSTEYDSGGVPRRFGVELWLGEDADGDQRPLRLAGEGTGGPAALTEGRLSMHPMRAHRGEVTGLGLYLLLS